MGGTISAVSTPGRGSVFTFSAYFDPPESAAGLPAAKAEAGDVPREVGARLLLVEDNPANRKIVELYLKDDPFVIDEAENGAEAVEKAAAGGYAAILMDMEMPVMDGYEATARIRKQETGRGGPPTPILALTAHAWTAQRERCFASGCTDFLSKPITRARLRETLYANLEKKGAKTDAAGSGRTTAGPATVSGAPEGAPAQKDASLAPPPPGPSDLRLPRDPELAGLMPGFLDSVEKDATLLRAAIGAGEFGEAARLARTLKGAGAGYGLPYVDAVAERLEKAAAGGNAAGALALVDALAGYLKRLRAG